MPGTRTRILALIAAAVLSVSAMSAENVTADPHAKHHKMQRSANLKVESTNYEIPDINLLDESGQPVNLKHIFANDRSVAVNFIFTTCTTICPVMTATMLQMQKELIADANQPHYISISIDPDYDSAAVLRKYADRFGASWALLTGSTDDIMDTLQALGAYRGNKVNHFPLTLMHSANSDEWTRIEGLTSSQELARIWRATAL
jgi:protein SCO1/2